jgi:hypothetical protein
MNLRDLFLMIFLLACCALLAQSASAAQRQCVLVEEFTNVGSNPCATANPAIRTLMTNMTRDTCIRISYHPWWPDGGDPFYSWNTMDVTDRTNAYAVPDVPAVYVDYTLQPSPTSTTTIRNNIRTRYAEWSPCTIDLVAAVSNTTTIRFVATVNAEDDMTGPDYRLYVVLISDLITYANAPGNNGETVFPDGFRDVYPNFTEGQPFAVGAGETFEMQGTLNRDNGWAAGSLTLIALVQDASTFEILQSKWADINLTPGTITVTSPVGGESWLPGNTEDITWTSTALPESVRVQLNRTFPSNRWETLAPALENTGAFSWLVTGPVSATARIRVTGFRTKVTADSSLANFAVAGVVLEAPHGGETWVVGDENEVRWSAPGVTEDLNIELNRHFPVDAWQNLGTVSAPLGIFRWTATGNSTASARVRISSTTRPEVRDSSQTNFAIAQRNLDVTVPNGGEVWVTGDTRLIRWWSQRLTGNVKVELNRSFPTGVWQVVTASTPDTGSALWTVTAPLTTSARVRVSSLDYPSVSDTSNANFRIASRTPPPVLNHDPLHDVVPGQDMITAESYEEDISRSVVSVRMFYRRVSATQFDSLTLTRSGLTAEYSAHLNLLSSGFYLYYLRTIDDGGVTTVQPSSAPDAVYTFRADSLFGTTLTYDNGSADAFNYSEDGGGAQFQWAVKFTAPQLPYYLGGAQFAASCCVPDWDHTRVQVRVYLANGPGGLPGTLMLQRIVGSIGNMPGGLETGANWAPVILKDALGDPVVITTPDFYVSVGNTEAGQYEAFARDTSGTNAHRSFVYDPCVSQWFNEDNAAGSSNTFRGNRLIRAVGYSLVQPQHLTAYRVSARVELRWAGPAAQLYRVYASPTADGPFTTVLGQTRGNVFQDRTALTNPDGIRFYRVVAATP